MSDEKQERYHDVNKLNRYFAISSLLLLIVVVLTFVDDYQTEWKLHQRVFRKKEVLKARELYQLEVAKRNNDENYQQLTKQLKQARADVLKKEDELREAKGKLETLKARQYADDQRFQFAKAEYEAAKFQYEEALGKGHGDEDEALARLQKLKNRMEELRRIAEETGTEFKSQQAQVDRFDKEVEELGDKRDEISKEVELVKRKLRKIDPYAMSFMNRLGNKFRDLPIVDFLNPYYKVDQVILPDIKDDLIFTQIGRVDRCTTCHQGMTKTDFEGEPQPHGVHPNLDLFLTSRSPHPVESFGCTSCHEGRSRGTSFTTSAHTPDNDEQKEEWEEEYHWHRMHHWGTPMYPKRYTEAGCYKCHSNETYVPGAEKLNKGMMLIERAGCYGCHKIEKYEGKLKRAPSLRKLSDKVSEQWAHRWVENPTEFRHNTWMPHYFDQYNNEDEESKKRNEQEIHAIVHYLFGKSEQFGMVDIPVQGDVERGEELVKSVGCTGCHQISPESTSQERTLDSMRREQGPNLAGMGTKASAKWIYNWLKDPKKYYSDTKMPNLRLSDQEAADIAAYLSTLKNEKFMESKVAAKDEKLLGQIAFEFLAKNKTEEQARQEVDAKTLDEKLSFVGEKMIAHYGCFGCHDIPGFEDAKPIGTELTQEGSKPLSRFDFGYVEIDHTHQAWFTTKLRNPRIFDRARVETKEPLEKLIMPNFGFTEDEIEAIVTVLLGMVEKGPYEEKIKPRTPENLFIEEGQRLVREYNCQGCHIMEGRGGVIQETVAEWLKEYEGKNPSDAISYSPPNLIGEGKKVHPQLLFKFLHDPTDIRPWLKVRMPTFGFGDQEINSLVKYFSYLDGAEFPFVQKELTPTEKSVELGKVLFNELQCGRCHIAGDQLPGGTPENWAPNFALAKDRLKPGWVVEWLKKPLDLLPGTKMPRFPYGEMVAKGIEHEAVKDTTAEEQMKALRDFLITNQWQSSDDD